MICLFYFGPWLPLCFCVNNMSHDAPSLLSADLWIAALLILLVMFVLVLVALLVFTGFICLRRRSLPSVLVSNHIHCSVELSSWCCSTKGSSCWKEPHCPSKLISKFIGGLKVFTHFFNCLFLGGEMSK